MTSPRTPPSTELSPAAAWSRRVRRIGGLIQLAFAAFWLVRGSLTIGGPTGAALAGLCGAVAIAAAVYGVRVTASLAPRPSGPEAALIERAITAATISQLIASFAAPALVIAAGHPAWLLPSIAVTIGPLLLWLDHLLHIPRYRPVGWALILGPVLLAATLPDTALAATTGIAAGLLLLTTATAGFHDLAAGRVPPQPGRR